MIYFDHNATTALDSEVLEAMLPYLTNFYGNPSSLHRHGRAVRTAVETAREQVAQLVGVSASQIIFTSGGTEANNLALKGVIDSLGGTSRLLIGATEHPSVTAMGYALKNAGHSLGILPVDNLGLVATNDLENELARNSTTLMSLMHANNETGVIENIAELAGIAKSHGVITHTDAVQSAGKAFLDFNSMNVDLMTISAHKIYGPKGIAALILNPQLNLEPLQKGGAQEDALRPGTENVAGIIGFGKAAAMAYGDLQPRIDHTAKLQTVLEESLNEIKGLNTIASKAARLSNTTGITLKQTDGEMLLMQLDQKSIAISSGSTCSSASKAPSPVLKAMGLSDTDALSAVRISFGKGNTLEEVGQFVTALKEIQFQNNL